MKDHPPIKRGHKIRLCCSQDEARRSKHSECRSKQGKLLAKQRYRCHSRLVIACLLDGVRGVRVITVRMHHVRHDGAEAVIPGAVLEPLVRTAEALSPDQHLPKFSMKTLRQQERTIGHPDFDLQVAVPATAYPTLPGDMLAPDGAVGEEESREEEDNGGGGKQGEDVMMGGVHVQEEPTLDFELDEDLELLYPDDGTSADEGTPASHAEPQSQARDPRSPLLSSPVASLSGACFPPSPASASNPLPTSNVSIYESAGYNVDSLPRLIPIFLQSMVGEMHALRTEVGQLRAEMGELQDPASVPPQLQRSGGTGRAHPLQHLMDER